MPNFLESIGIFAIVLFFIAITLSGRIRLSGRVQFILIAAFFISVFLIIANIWNSTVSLFAPSTATLPPPTSAPMPTDTPYNLATREAEGISAMQTSVAKQKNTCTHWSKITLLMEGKTLCVYGNIYDIYATNDSFTRVRFTSKKNSFFFHSTNFYYTDPLTDKEIGTGDCVSTTSTVVLYSGVPSMKITDLYLCDQ